MEGSGCRAIRAQTQTRDMASASGRVSDRKASVVEKSYRVYYRLGSLLLDRCRSEGLLLVVSKTKKVRRGKG